MRRLIPSVDVPRVGVCVSAGEYAFVSMDVHNEVAVVACTRLASCLESAGGAGGASRSTRRRSESSNPAAVTRGCTATVGVPPHGTVVADCEPMQTVEPSRGALHTPRNPRMKLTRGTLNCNSRSANSNKRKQ